MSAPTRGPVNTIYGTVGVTPTTVLSFLGRYSNSVLNFLQIQNTHTTNLLAYTFDNVDPVINGAGNTLLPYGDITCDNYVINGPGDLKVVGSAAGTTFTILYA